MCLRHQQSLAPVQIFANEATEERSENARLVCHVKALMSSLLLLEQLLSVTLLKARLDQKEW